jgi:predicted small secreted protein
MRSRVTLLLLLSVLLLSACNTLRGGGTVVVSGGEPAAGPAKGNVPPPQAPAHGRRDGNGPPPHAPAHGYRHQQPDGVELVFDSGLGVYVAVDLQDVFFLDGVYLRLRDGVWQISVRLGDDHWRPAKDSEVPVKLKNAKGPKGKDKNKGNGRGQGPGAVRTG